MIFLFPRWHQFFYTADSRGTCIRHYKSGAWWHLHFWHCHLEGSFLGNKKWKSSFQSSLNQHQQWLLGAIEIWLPRISFILFLLAAMVSAGHLQKDLSKSAPRIFCNICARKVLIQRNRHQEIIEHNSTAYTPLSPSKPNRLFQVGNRNTKGGHVKSSLKPSDFQLAPRVAGKIVSYFTNLFVMGEKW